MDLYQFNFQDNKGKAALIWKHGIFIEFRDEGESRVVLNDMGKYYAELWFDVDMENIKLVRGFRSFKCLDPYLKKVDLSDILF